MRRIAVFALLLCMFACSKKFDYDTSLEEANRVMAKNTPKAVKILTRLIQTEPEDPRAYGLLGVIYYKTKQYDKAAENFVMAVDFTKDYAEKKEVIGGIDQLTSEFLSKEESDHSEAARKAVQAGSPDEAIAELNKALELNSGNMGLYYGMGYAYSAKGDFKNAQKYFEEARAINPLNLATLKELAYVYSNQKNFDAGQKLLLETVRFHGSDPLVVHQLGINYLRTGNGEPAEAALKKNIELYPSFYLSYFTLGQYYYNNSRFDEARPLLEAVQKNFTEEYAAKMNLSLDVGAMRSMASQMLTNMK